MKHATCGLLIAFLTAGCVHGSAVEQVHAGMSREEVSSVMGPPESVAAEPGRECAYYTVLKDFMSRTPWSMSDRYYVCYASGKVDTFGKAQSVEGTKGS